MNISFTIPFQAQLWRAVLFFLALSPLTMLAQVNPDLAPVVVKPLSLDNRIMTHLAENRTPEQTGFFMFISKYNNLVNVSVPAGVLAAGIINNDKGTRQDALYIASSSAVNFFLTTVIKTIIRRPRPFNGRRIKINAVYQPHSTSFPSGHSSSAFTTATALSQVYNKWYVIAPAYLYAGAIGYSRMYLGVHYPTDVAAGAVLGTATGLSMKFVRPGK
jgi:membrane-associated phospholipid phosphatase